MPHKKACCALLIGLSLLPSLLSAPSQAAGRRKHALPVPLVVAEPPPAATPPRSRLGRDIGPAAREVDRFASALVTFSALGTEALNPPTQAN